jgi:hypothetical protein
VVSPRDIGIMYRASLHIYEERLFRNLLTASDKNPDAKVAYVAHLAQKVGLATGLNNNPSFAYGSSMKVAFVARATRRFIVLHVEGPESF